MAKLKNSHHKLLNPVLLVVTLVLAVGVIVTVLNPMGSIASGYDEYGYNYRARMFNGKVDGADRNLDGTYWGDKTYANDKLVMKWSKEWDDARFNGQTWTCDSWTSNEWNGKMPGGSGEVWHYKISWVGPELQKSTCWREGGYPIWGQFEVTFSQGSVGNKHFWDAHAERNGYGVFK